MNVYYRKTKIRKLFDSERSLKRKYGARMAEAIIHRVSVLRKSINLSEVPTTKPTRCHQLSGDRDEKFAMDLVHPYRLVFEAKSDPVPRDKFGGIDRDRVKEVIIIGVVDYHR